MSRCRDTVRRPESAEPISGRPARWSQARTRRPRSASASTSSSASPVPRSHISTRSQCRRIGSESGSRTSTSGIGGGGQTTHRPAFRAAASCSAEAGSAKRTQLNPSAASASSGSPFQSIDRGKNGRPSTSSTPRESPVGGSTGTASAPVAGCTSGSAMCRGDAAAAATSGGGTRPVTWRSSIAISKRPGVGGASSTRCVARAPAVSPGPCSSRSGGSWRASAAGRLSTSSSSQWSTSRVVPPRMSTSTGRPVLGDTHAGRTTRTAIRTSGRLARTQTEARSSSRIAAGPNGSSIRSGWPAVVSRTSRSQARPRWGEASARSCTSTRPAAGSAVHVGVGPSKPSCTSPPRAHDPPPRPVATSSAAQARTAVTRVGKRTAMGIRERSRHRASSSRRHTGSSRDGENGRDGRKMGRSVVSWGLVPSSLRAARG